MSRDALVVGINTYGNLQRLDAPAEDAEAIAQLLTDSGEFRVKRIPEAVTDNTVQVGRKTKVTLTELEEALVQLFLPQGKTIPDTALFYFSGHGLRKNRGIQEGFLATSDVNPDLGNWGLSLQWLRRLLEESPIRQQIIWLDCCYSGELLNFDEANPGEKGKGRDRCFIAASREFEVSYQDISEPYSVLTKALLQGLDPKRCPDRWVTNYTLIDFLNQQLKSETQRPIFTNFGQEINLTRQWEKATAVVTVSPNAICPYKGLAYFDCNEEDPKYFYGRAKLTNQLLDRVRQSNFLAILGASGSGKSSVLRAGLLHQLKLGRQLSGSEQWQTYIMQPGEHPLHSLALAFVDPNLSPVERGKQLGDAEDLIKQGATGLRRLVQASPSRVLLVIDQFEEAFTLCRDKAERQKFFACILEALEQIGSPNVETLHVTSLQIIIAMRADFFGKCLEQNYSGLAQQIQGNMVTVTPMNPEELRQAIVEPAKRVNLEIEPELVEEILTDVANAPGSLPLLQYALTELWRQRTDNCLRLQTYAQLGGVMGTLRKRADEVYKSFSEAQQAAAQHIFLSLTQLGEGTEDTRRRVLKPDLVNQRYAEQLIDQVVQKLADEKLIVTSEMVEKGSASGRVAVVDVAHEALIRQWPLLRQWIDENRDILRQKRKIEAAAEEWKLNRQSKDYLLRGKPLAEAIDFARNRGQELTLSNLVQEFIRVSLNQTRINRLKSLIIPALSISAIAFVIGYPYLKQQQINQAWEIIKQASSPGKREAIKFLHNNGISLKSVELTEIDLPQIDLSKARLERAYFGRANLQGANLQSANLQSANLQGANLQSANLQGANLQGANLQGANLQGANLQTASFEGADLLTANLQSTNIKRANLRKANLKNANLEQASLILSDLGSANLVGANLKQANLYWAVLQSADLSDANLTKADLRKTNLDSAILQRANLIEANIKGATFTRVDFEEVNLEGVDLRGFDLAQFNFKDANLQKANLENASLQKANLERANLKHANLQNADLEGANFQITNIIRANVFGANLVNVRNLSTNRAKSARNWQRAKYDQNFAKQLGLTLKK